MCDFRALTGDPADSLPGVRGIGPKTAARLRADGLANRRPPAVPGAWPGAYTYPRDIDAGLAARLARAGCRALFLGIESLAQGVRVGKHHAKHPSEVARAVDTLHDHGIFVHGNFIIGLPGETADTSTFYDPSHAYFATATLTQAQMKALAAVFRRRVEDEHLACWNLSDYALLCWRSVGGDAADLARLWQQPDRELDDGQRLVVNVLKEKTGVTLPGQAAGFVGAARRVAVSSSAGVVAG